MGQNGRAECTLHAGTVVIGGVVRGEVFSTEKVIILSTGLLLGNVTTPRLIVEEGVILNGSCTITAPAGAPAGAPGGLLRDSTRQDARGQLRGSPWGFSGAESSGRQAGSTKPGAKAEWSSPQREPAPAQGQKR